MQSGAIRCNQVHSGAIALEPRGEVSASPPRGQQVGPWLGLELGLGLGSGARGVRVRVRVSPSLEPRGQVSESPPRVQ